MNRFWTWGPLMIATLGLAGCHLDMYQQPKIKSQSENTFYADGKGTRLPVVGTIEFGKPNLDGEFYTGYGEDGKLVREMPIQVNEAVIKRGKERFEIFCQHCHGPAGDGKGMIAQRGFELARPVGNYHTDRLRKMSAGHFFDVMTNGYGTMYGHASRIKPLDRWSIVAYIRALQVSQGATTDQLDGESMGKLGIVKSGVFEGPLFNTSPQANPVKPEVPTVGSQPPTGAVTGGGR